MCLSCCCLWILSCCCLWILKCYRRSLTSFCRSLCARAKVASSLLIGLCISRMQPTVTVPVPLLFIFSRNPHSIRSRGGKAACATAVDHKINHCALHNNIHNNNNGNSNGNGNDEKRKGKAQTKAARRKPAREAERRERCNRSCAARATSLHCTALSRLTQLPALLPG